MGKKLYQDKEWLEEQYWEKKMPLSQVAKLAKCSFVTVYRWMKHYKIPRRSLSEIGKRAYDSATLKGIGLRQKQAESMKAAWERGDFDGKERRQKISKAVKNAWGRGVYKNMHTKEYRQKRAKAAKAAWERGDYGEEWRRKNSETTKAAWERGDLGDEKHRQKVSESVKAAWERGDYGEEWRRKQSEIMKARWGRGDLGDEEWKRKVSEAKKAAWASGKMDGVFQSPTSIEIAVSEALDALGIEHEQQYRPDGYSRVYDEFIPPNVLIEVQGDYWHSSDEAQERDAEKAAWARDNGYILVAIWGHEIREVGALTLVEERVIPLLQKTGNGDESAQRWYRRWETIVDAMEGA